MSLFLILSYEKKDTIVTRCEDSIPEFRQFNIKFQQTVILAGRSMETYKNYIRAIAQISFHYQKVPILLNDQQINSYLLSYKVGNLDRKTPSEAYFKHIVFGLRYMFKAFDIPNRKISMPVMKYKKSIPDILNRKEVFTLLIAPKMIKHRLLFALAYGSGLRINEVQNVKIADIDVVTKLVHVRHSKNGHDRLVPISDDFIRGFNTYLNQFKLQEFLFPGKSPEKPLSKGGIQHVLIHYRRKIGIIKKISMHNLRHSYAVHFLEDTGDLLKLKQYLGHRDIKNTMRYLKHVQILPSTDPYSPLTKVFNLVRENRNQ